MAHHKPARMTNTKATDKGINKYKMSMPFFQPGPNPCDRCAGESVKGCANLKALRTTTKELSAMPRPAAQAGNQPIKAKGTQVAL